MKFIFSTGSLHTYGTERIFALAAAVGFDGLELMADQRWDTRQADHLKQLIERYRLPILAVHSPFFGVPGWPKDPVGLLRESLTLAEAIGAGVVIHHLPLRAGYAILSFGGGKRLTLPLPGWDMEGDYRRWLLTDYPQLQAQTNVALCIENMPTRRVIGGDWNAHTWNSVAAMKRFPALTMDTTHLGTWGLDPCAVYLQWQGRVRHIHLSNFDGREHRRPETGHLRLDLLLGLLAATDYQGTVSFELHPDTLDAGQSDDHVQGLLTHSLQLCRRWAGRHHQA